MKKFEPIAQRQTNIPAECSITDGNKEYLVKGRLGIVINYHEVYGLQISYDVFTNNRMKVAERKCKSSKWNRGQIFFSPIYINAILDIQKELWMVAQEILSDKKIAFCRFRSDIKEECCNE